MLRLARCISTFESRRFALILRPRMSAFVLYGAGGHARVVLDIARAAGLEPDWCIDDQPKARHMDGVPILGSDDARWTGLVGFRFLVSIGDNSARSRVYARLVQRGGVPRSLIHPSAWVSPRAAIGVGTVVMAGAVVNAGVRVGSNAILNTGCSIDHDCMVADHVHICPGVRLAGDVHVGELSLLGIGTCVIPGIRIGGGSCVGAGSVVVRDVPSDSCAYGNPARVRTQTT